MNMAFFMTMPSVVVLVLLLILSPPLLSHQPKNFAVADYKLMQSLCHKSNTPETCMRCLKSSKGAVTADSVGIATVIVRCMKVKARTLAQNITKLDSTSDANLRSISKRCGRDYGHYIARKYLTETKHALQNHKFDNAESFVIGALRLNRACHRDLKGNFHEKVPSNVFIDMKAYEELSEAVSRIIEKLHKG
ncbi:unnamed protein product [Sphenostylis stenocarpa]|uniref:Pectinesterase inhibitor domain-containing protein n=1 Tax=Sphenostylis stenocarpa TaxID=92480 RepID=A0AA86SNR9_9FABA|nr:unnamed protein product [Sphenostylis stenocarpa]